MRAIRARGRLLLLRIKRLLYTKVVHDENKVYAVQKYFAPGNTVVK